MNLKNLIDLLPYKFKASDTKIVSNGKGILESFLEICGTHLEEIITPEIDNILELIDINKIPEMYLNYLWEFLGEIPLAEGKHIDKDNFKKYFNGFDDPSKKQELSKHWLYEKDFPIYISDYQRRNILRYAITLIKIRGTKLFFTTLFDLYGITCSITDPVDSSYNGWSTLYPIYDSTDYRYDSALYDYDPRCNQCITVTFDFGNGMNFNQLLNSFQHSKAFYEEKTRGGEDVPDIQYIDYNRDTDVEDNGDLGNTKAKEQGTFSEGVLKSVTSIARAPKKSPSVLEPIHLKEDPEEYWAANENLIFQGIPAYSEDMYKFYTFLYNFIDRYKPYNVNPFLLIQGRPIDLGIKLTVEEFEEDIKNNGGFRDKLVTRDTLKGRVPDIRARYTVDLRTYQDYTQGQKLKRTYQVSKDGVTYGDSISMDIPLEITVPGTYYIKSVDLGTVEELEVTADTLHTEYSIYVVEGSGHISPSKPTISMVIGGKRTSQEYDEKGNKITTITSLLPSISTKNYSTISVDESSDKLLTVTFSFEDIVTDSIAKFYLIDHPSSTLNIPILVDQEKLTTVITLDREGKIPLTEEGYQDRDIRLSYKDNKIKVTTPTQYTPTTKTLYVWPLTDYGRNAYQEVYMNIDYITYYIPEDKENKCFEITLDLPSETSKTITMGSLNDSLLSQNLTYETIEIGITTTERNLTPPTLTVDQPILYLNNNTSQIILEPYWSILETEEEGILPDGYNSYINNEYSIFLFKKNTSDEWEPVVADKNYSILTSEGTLIEVIQEGKPIYIPADSYKIYQSTNGSKHLILEQSILLTSGEYLWSNREKTTDRYNYTQNCTFKVVDNRYEDTWSLSTQASQWNSEEDEWDSIDSREDSTLYIRKDEYYEYLTFYLSLNNSIYLNSQDIPGDEGSPSDIDDFRVKVLKEDGSYVNFELKNSPTHPNQKYYQEAARGISEIFWPNVVFIFNTLGNYTLEVYKNGLLIASDGFTVSTVTEDILKEQGYYKREIQLYATEEDQSEFDIEDSFGNKKPYILGTSGLYINGQKYFPGISYIELTNTKIIITDPYKPKPEDTIVFEAVFLKEDLGIEISSSSITSIIEELTREIQNINTQRSQIIIPIIEDERTKEITHSLDHKPTVKILAYSSDGSMKQEQVGMRVIYSEDSHITVEWVTPVRGYIVVN